MYLLLGYGSSLQYDDVDRAAADLGELLGAVQQRTQGRVRRVGVAGQGGGGLPGCMEVRCKG